MRKFSGDKPEKKGDDKPYKRRESDGTGKFGQRDKSDYRKKSASSGEGEGPRSWKKRDDSNSDRRGSKSTGAKPWAKREGPERKPWARKEEGERKPWARGEEGDRKPRTRRDDGDRKPWADKSGEERKPWARGEEGDRKPRTRRDDGDRKPWANKSGEERKPWARSEEGDRKPHTRRDDGDRKLWANKSGEERKPWARGEEGDRKPHTRRDDGDRKPWGDKSGEERKPWARSEEGDRKPHTRRDDGERKPWADKSGEERKPWARKEEGERKPWARKEEGERKPWARKDNSDEKRPWARRDDDERKSWDKTRERSSGSGSKEKSFSKRSSDKDKDDDGFIRLNKYIANAGVCSRREADTMIEAGVIKVNGEIITELGVKVGPDDKVQIGDETLNPQKKVYLLLNKPKGYITTVDDPQERNTVMMLVKDACRERIYPVGRLDRNTSGLLLMTNDGEMAKKLTHPSHRIRKIYQVEVNRTFSKSDMVKLTEGVELEDGLMAVDEIAYTGNGDEKKVLGVVVHSGKNRVVRRLFEALDYEVVKLDRVAFANLTKKDLPRGRFRFLTESEINMLKMI